MSLLAPFTKRSWGLIVLVVGLFFALWVAPARAENVQLAYRHVPTCQGNTCITPISPTASPAAGPAASKESPSQWTWFIVDPARLQRMPVGWNLVIDNVRFTAIEIRVVHDGGVAVIRRGQFELTRNWTMGNNLRFQIPVAGPDVTAIQIGYRNMDAPDLLRTIKAMDAAGHESHVLRWTVQVALVLGMLFSAFVYNMFLLTWLRTGFQRWYVVWLAGSLGYLLVWSGAILNIFPFLAGPASVRTFYLLLGLLVVSGAAFFFSLIEKDKLPQRLIDFGQLAGMGVALTSVVAAFDTFFLAAVSDLLLNVWLIVITLTLTVASGFAALRGSRAIWYYLAGWVPALAVLVLRIFRNLGLLPQDDLVDLAGFAAIGWESLLLSLAIADRFRQLRRDADAADAERETLFRVATTDALTGLGNRALFQNMLEQPLARNSGIDVIAIDIDFLKQTNDMAGHDAGDALIVAVAERLTAAAGPEANIARVGGDEFVILLTGAARERLSAVRQMIALSSGVPLRHSGHNLTISICAGHSASEDKGMSLARIFKQADLALYRAKAAGRGCWRSYDSSMADEAEARTRLLSEARVGLAGNQFMLHYQRVVQLDDTLVGYEALLRWQHPRLGLLAPGDFPDVLRESTLLPQLQAHVLKLALEQLATLRSDGRDLTMAVNFVGSQLQGTAAAVAVLDELARYRVPPHSLVVEVTELVVMSGLGGALIEALECLRDAGVSVALDDFGTGHASLIQLRDVPANIVKIDRSFIARLSESAGNQQVVRATIDLAHSMGKQVVAEGVENDAQRQLLTRLGCDLAQGWLFGQPQPFPLTRRAAA
ncbi:EAL domain-containing protein [Sandarakinorhabdus sp.]|uniref:putative bifunctional diguanylate cyclase/phosphodiesterase n=1 Tax=Sandarakinorhabdus sp. TaxID=1916663 RepID=UPI00286E5C31|nr:EAL domain-containing protein [Sandarakinorhabdus sp.]